jgi:hypothetical protein
MVRPTHHPEPSRRANPKFKSYKDLNPDKPAYGSERNNKLQAPPDLKIRPNKFQITISKSQIRPNVKCLGF